MNPDDCYRPALVIVSGTRSQPTQISRSEILERLKPELRVGAVLMHGAACGVDRCASAWWDQNGGVQLPMPAQWGVHGKLAGPLRNQAMVDAALSMHACGWTVMALCFPAPSSPGTWDMIGRLRWERGSHKLRAPQPQDRWTVYVHQVEIV